MGVLKWAIFRNFALFRLPASAASDVGLTLKTRLNTLKQPRENFATNQLVGKNLLTLKGKKILVQKKEKFSVEKNGKKISTNQLVGKREKNFWPKKGKILMKNFKG